MTEQAKIPREDRAFIRLLGRLLGEVIREQRGTEAFELVVSGHDVAAARVMTASHQPR